MHKPSHNYLQHRQALVHKRRKMAWARIRAAYEILSQNVQQAVIVHKGARY